MHSWHSVLAGLAHGRVSSTCSIAETGRMLLADATRAVRLVKEEMTFVMVAKLEWAMMCAWQALVNVVNAPPAHCSQGHESLVHGIGESRGRRTELMSTVSGTETLCFASSALQVSISSYRAGHRARVAILSLHYASLSVGCQIWPWVHKVGCLEQ